MRSGDIFRTGMKDSDLIQATEFSRIGVYGLTKTGRKVFVPYVKIFEASEADKLEFRQPLEAIRSKLDEAMESWKGRLIAHKKSGQEYRVSGVCIREGSLEIYIAYVDLSEAVLWIRPLSEIKEKFRTVLK